MAGIGLISKLAPTDRKGRYPKHTFRVNTAPFEIVPIMTARVLPGETLKNLYFESRVVTPPIKNSIIGWKKEYYFFYVRITDLLVDAAKQMFVDPANAEIPADILTNDKAFYAGKGGFSWTKQAYQRIVQTYFRDAGETAAQHVSANGYSFAQTRESTFLDSLTNEAAMPDGAAIAGATNMADLERLLDAFEQLRALGFAEMTYEDWLRTNGIAIPNKDENKPELLARFSEFQYPSNTIDPVTGAPSSAVSWVFKNGERKPKFFKEPGFVIGLSVTRAKVYFGGLSGSALGWARRSWDWMPNYLRDAPETALKPFAIDAGPLGERAVDAPAYFLDMRDELLYGDQFQNLAALAGSPINDSANHILPLPGTDLNYKYVTDAMSKAFLKAPGAFIIQDGYASLSIKGFEQDYTKGQIAQL